MVYDVLAALLSIHPLRLRMLRLPPPSPSLTPSLPRKGTDAENPG